MNIKVRTRSEPFKHALGILLCLFFLSLSSSAQDCKRIAGPSTFDRDLLAAQQGDTVAALKTGKAFYNGVRAKRSYYDAAKWFEVAANGGSAEAKAWLGASYLFGLGVKTDPMRGRDLIVAAADEGSPIGTRFLGLMYQTGQGMPRDYAKAISLLRKAADRGDGYSFNALGTTYKYGIGVERNGEIAKSMFEKGAAMGDSWALLHLGEIYATGELPTGRNRDLTKALELYSAATKAGNPLAPFRMGKLYETGTFGRPELSRIFACYQESAISGFAMAQVEVGKAYEHGIGTEVNPLEAYVWYSLAMERGNREASNLLEPLIDKLSYAQATEARALLRKRRELTGRILGR